MRRSPLDGCFNLLTIIFLLLTLGVAIGVVLLYTKTIQPPAALQPITPTLPQLLFVPSPTATGTDTLTPLPTQTDRPTATTVPSKTKTFTPTPSDTPTITDTPVPPSETAIPTNTPLPSKTPLPTKTLPPTVDPNLPTRTPTGFPFRADAPSFIANINQSVGCSFEGLTGQVYGLNNETLVNVSIAVTGGNGFNSTVTNGSNTTLGTGWLIQLGQAPDTQTVTVELRNPAGVPLSAPVQVSFPGSCTGNLGIVNFFQTRPY